MADPEEPGLAPDVNSLSFEESFQRLSEMAESLEDGGLTLAEATARYEEGMSLVQRCNQLLDEAELKITSLKEAFATPSDDQGADDVDDPLF
jgi:exodeoxyribonuclease VII small subunit